METRENLNDCQLSRLKIATQSRIPKPKVSNAKASTLSSFPVHLQSTKIYSEPCTPKCNLNLDSLMDSALKASMATVAGEEHSWLIGAERASSSNVDELLDQFEEFQDCIDVAVEPLHTLHNLPSEIEESQGSYDGPIDTTVKEEDEVYIGEESNHPNGYLQVFMSRLYSIAKTLDWLKAQPFSFTPETPLERSNTGNNNIDTRSNGSNTHSTGASSCKSSRSLSAAFDLAALEPAAFQFSGTVAVQNLESGCSSSCVSRSITTHYPHEYSTRLQGRLHFGYEEEDEDDFLSACSDFEEEESTVTAITAASPGQISISSKSSGADSDELHQSLLKTASMGVGGVNEWLSNGWQDQY